MLQMAVSGSLNEKLEINGDNLRTNIENGLGNNDFEFTDNGDGSYKLKINDNMYYISNNGEINKMLDRSNINVGDYVEYHPDVNSEGYEVASLLSGYSTDQTFIQEDLIWRILRIYNDGSIALISDGPTDSSLYLYGAFGYNNGVYLINEICKSLYSNESQNIVGRSINISDIEELMNNEGRETKENYINEMGIKYGEIKLYQNGYYPFLYSYENGSGIDSNNIKTNGINQSEMFFTSENIMNNSQVFKQTQSIGLNVTQTFYRMESVENYIENNITYEMLFNSNYEDYWIASRNINATAYAYFSLFVGGDNILTNHALYRSNNESYEYAHLIFPIVTLSPETEIIICEGNNSQINMHKIKDN